MKKKEKKRPTQKGLGNILHTAFNIFRPSPKIFFFVTAWLAQLVEYQTIDRAVGPG